MPESPGEIESMGSKLFVGGLSWGTTDSTLRAAFEAFGSLREARVILDRETGKSRGFGFVTFASEEDAVNAIRQMNGAMVDGRTIRVNEAEERRGPGGPGGPGGPRGDRPGGGYGDRPAGGGYGDRGAPGGGYRGDRPGGPPGRDRDRGPRPEVHTRGRAPYRGDGDRGPGGPGGPGGPRGDRPWAPSGGGGGGFRGPPSGGAGAPNQPASDDWGEDRKSRGDRRAKKKAVKAPTGTWDEDAMRMRAPQKREKRESGRTWRDYTTDEDFDEATRPPGEEEEKPVADGEEKPADETTAPDAPDGEAPGDATTDREAEPEDAVDHDDDDEDEDEDEDVT